MQNAVRPLLSRTDLLPVDRLDDVQWGGGGIERIETADGTVAGYSQVEVAGRRIYSRSHSYDRGLEGVDGVGANRKAGSARRRIPRNAQRNRVVNLIVIRVVAPDLHASGGRLPY